MKKFICVLFSLVLTLSVFSLTACGNSDLQDKIASLEEQISALENEVDALKEKSASQLPSFEDVEIGYQLEVYPKVAFDYKVSEDCIVHIESITATLTAKNEINEGDVLEEAFDRYVITYTITGHTNGLFEGKTVRFFLSTYPGGYGVFGNVGGKGTFVAEISSNLVTSNTIIYFTGCSISN